MRLHITVPAQMCKQAYKKIMGELRKGASVDGYRKGKVGGWVGGRAGDRAGGWVAEWLRCVCWLLAGNAGGPSIAVAASLGGLLPTPSQRAASPLTPSTPTHSAPPLPTCRVPCPACLPVCLPCRRPLTMLSSPTWAACSGWPTL